MFNPADGPVAGLGIGLTLAAEHSNGFNKGYEQACDEMQAEINAAYHQGFQQGKEEGWKTGRHEGWEQAVAIANSRIDGKNAEIEKLKSEIERLKIELNKERNNTFRTLLPLMDAKKVEKLLHSGGKSKLS